MEVFDPVLFTIAIADEIRQKIMKLCCCRSLSVNEIVEQMNVTQPTVSHHLAILLEEGLMDIQEKGKQTFYRLNQRRVSVSCGELKVFYYTRGTMMIDLGSVRSRPEIMNTTARQSRSDRWDHFLARIGVRRSGHRIEPGLCALGMPNPDSPAFVTSNQTLSFGSLRSPLSGFDGYILVLDTKGINVWCAAGKGTFGTDEIVLRVMIPRLGEVVQHRRSILPQLGAPGMAAPQVKKRTGFWVEYRPERAADLPEYLMTKRAMAEMRQVRFSLPDCLVLIPVDVIRLLLPTIAVAVALYLVGVFC